jgi:hypothetical protein
VRAIVVVLAFLYALAFGIPTALYLGGYYGSIGVVKTGTAGPVADRDVNTVTEVLPGSPAARAGIVPGDVVVRAEAEHAPPFEQLLVRVPAGQPIPYAVVHDGRSRIVDLTPQPIRVAPVRSAVIIAMLVRGAAIALIGALLVLLRPSIMTAAFSILCLEFAELSHPAGNVELVAALPLFWKPLFLAVTCIVNGGGPAVAAIFSMRFPSGTPLPSWRPVEKAMVVVGVLTIVLYFAALYFGGTASVLGSLLYELVTIIFWLSYTVAVAAFMVRYAHSSGEDRARLRWVAIGLGSFVVSYALFWYAENSASAPRDLSWWAQFLNILPFTVAYAVVHHRVIDVRIAGGRAIAFAVMSAVPVIGFSLIDLGLSNGLQSTKFALVAEIAVAVGFGFWVNASQRRIDNLIESVFFHTRRVAEQRLGSVARRLVHASDRSVVDETLVREPYEALRLTAVALYLRAGERYVRVTHRGWPDDALPEIDANDSLALELVATGEPVDVKAIAWERERAIAALQPAAAFPICVRRETTGFLLLGEKTDGERLDALERAAVQTLVEAAANVYDHLEGEEQRRIAAELRRALDEAIRQNQTLRALLQREATGA